MKIKNFWLLVALLVGLLGVTGCTKKCEFSYTLNGVYAYWCTDTTGTWFYTNSYGEVQIGTNAHTNIADFVQFCRLNAAEVVSGRCDL